jgi:hypothetical protein
MSRLEETLYFICECVIALFVGMVIAAFIL